MQVNYIVLSKKHKNTLLVSPVFVFHELFSSERFRCLKFERRNEILRCLKFERRNAGVAKHSNLRKNEHVMHQGLLKFALCTILAHAVRSHWHREIEHPPRTHTATHSDTNESIEYSCTLALANRA